MFDTAPLVQPLHRILLKRTLQRHRSGFACRIKLCARTMALVFCWLFGWKRKQKPLSGHEYSSVAKLAIKLHMEQMNGSL